MKPTILEHLTNLATQAALKAGKYIAESSQQEIAVMYKAGGDSLASQVVTEVDGKAQEIILQILKPSFADHDIALLAEETDDDGSRLKKEYFWCIDPLDGTLPFTIGKPGYAVSIALIRRDGIPVLGVIYDPVTQRLFSAALGKGVYINDKLWTSPIPTDSDCLNICFDCSFEMDSQRTEITQQMEAFVKEQGFARANIVVGGGAVLNACYVLGHPPAIYFKPPKEKLGGGSLWDFGATTCLFNEAGAHARDFSGNALKLNEPGSTFMDHCGVCFSTSSDLAMALKDFISR